MKQQDTFTFRQYAWQQFRRHRPAVAGLYLLFLLVLVALLAPVIANDKPLTAVYHGERISPALHPNKTYVFILDDGQEVRLQADIAAWKTLPLEKVLWAPIPWSPGKNDYSNAHFKAPGGEQFFADGSGTLRAMPRRFRHVLGTNNTGEDVAAGLIHGTRISLSIGFIAMGIAAVIGLLLGAIAGFFGDRRVRFSMAQWLMLLPISFLAWYYGYQMRRFQLADALADGSIHVVMPLVWSLFIAVLIFVAGWQMSRLLNRIPALQRFYYFPVDSFISRLIEIVHSLPVFILIITIAAIAKPSLTNVMVIIGLTSWTGIARFTRAEFLKVRQMDYMSAAASLGYGPWRMIWKHALPNCMAPALVSIAFGIATAILVESALSFLGVGVPPGTVTWGSMVNEGRQQYSAWWLVIFPGTLIFLTVTAYNLIGEALRDALDPRLKS